MLTFKQKLEERHYLRGKKLAEDPNTKGKDLSFYTYCWDQPIGKLPLLIKIAEHRNVLQQDHYRLALTGSRLYQEKLLLAIVVNPKAAPDTLNVIFEHIKRMEVLHAKVEIQQNQDGYKYLVDVGAYYELIKDKMANHPNRTHLLESNLKRYVRK